jgi:hypothetical protein
MKIRIISESKKYSKEECINVIPFGMVETVDFRKQINGSGKELVELGRLSEKLGGVTLVSAESYNCGIKKKSIFVFEGARLVSICDMNEYQEKYTPSFGYKSIDFKGKKIGLLVDKDIYSVAAVNALVLSGNHAIINLYAGLLPQKAIIGGEFYAYVNGVDFLCVGKDLAVAFNERGERLTTIEGEVNFKFEGVYREVRKKTRGSF